MKLLLFIVLIIFQLTKLLGKSTNYVNQSKEEVKECSTTWLTITPSKEKNINKKELFMEYEIGEQCHATHVQILCQNNLFKADFKLDEKIIVLNPLKANTEYSCEAKLFNDNEIIFTTYNFKFATAEGIHVEQSDFNQITFKVEYDGISSIDKFYLKLNDDEYSITPNKQLRINNLPSCKRFDVELMALSKDQMYNLGNTSVTVQPDNLIFSTIRKGYFQHEFSVTFNRINSLCSMPVALLECKDDISMDVIFKDLTATLQLTNLKPESQFWCEIHATFDDNEKATYSYYVRTEQALEVKLNEQNEISIIFHYDGAKNYDYFNLVNVDDGDEMKIELEKEFIIRDTKSCKKYNYEVVGVRFNTGYDVLEKKSIATAPGDPTIKATKPLAFYHEIEISYSKNDLCVAKTVTATCPSIALNVVADFVNNTGKLIFKNLQSNKEYECRTTIYLKDDHHNLVLSFTTQKAIVAKSTKPNEISFKFTYEGEKQFDSFSIKSDGFDRQVKNNEELIIKDAEGGKTYKIQLFGELKDKLDVLLGSEIVTVMSKDHEEEEKPPNCDKPRLKINSFTLELN